MAKVISQFFADLGYPLRNLRWSWGARREDVILLRTWTDEFAFKERRLRVLHTADAETRPDSFGLDERMVHLRSLWEGGIAGYTVIATAKDKAAPTREIASYRDDVVFPLLRLEQNENQDIIAIVGPPVAVAALPKHALTHRTAPGAGDFPLDDSQRSGLSTDSYKDKLPAIRAWLIEVCHVRGTVTYSDVMDRFALTFYPLRNAMSRLGHDCREAGEPVITALIVDKDTRRCSPGIFEEFHIDDDVLERERCYAHWAPQPAATATPAVEPSMADAPHPDTPPGVAPGTPNDDFEQRVARFTQVQTRPEQPSFRAAVFRACGGRCVISGCSVPEALEAAHLFGRDWRQGHNSASDGILLRRDLHTLYDRGLLRLSEAGHVELSEDVQADYGEFAGIAVAYPSARPAPG
jgi:hypothetical protein